MSPVIASIWSRPIFLYIFPPSFPTPPPSHETNYKITMTMTLRSWSYTSRSKRISSSLLFYHSEICFLHALSKRAYCVKCFTWWAPAALIRFSIYEHDDIISDARKYWHLVFCSFLYLWRFSRDIPGSFDSIVDHQMMRWLIKLTRSQLWSTIRHAYMTQDPHYILHLNCTYWLDILQLTTDSWTNVDCQIQTKSLFNHGTVWWRNDERLNFNSCISDGWRKYRAHKQQHMLGSSNKT